MATSVPLTQVRASSVQQLLAKETDPHRRQRELVRASLFSCPGKRGARAQ